MSIWQTFTCWYEGRKKEEKLDYGDYSVNYKSMDNDLNKLKNVVKIPEQKYSLEPFYLMIFIALILFMIKEFYL